MSYFKDDIINQVVMAAFLCDGDPGKAKLLIIDIKDREKPQDEEVSLLMDKMIFIALDSPKKFKQMASLLIKKIQNEPKSK